MTRIWVDRTAIGGLVSGQATKPIVIQGPEGLRRGANVEICAPDGTVVARIVSGRHGPRLGIHVWVELQQGATVRVE